MALRITARRLSAIARGSAPLSTELAELVRLALLGRETEQAPDMVVVSRADSRPAQKAGTTFEVQSDGNLRLEGILLGSRVKLVRQQALVPRPRP